jgi:general secretion pathway protein G
LAIIAICAVVYWILPIFGPRFGSGARVAATVTQIAAFKNALGKFQSDTGHFPRSEYGLLPLFHETPGETNRHGPYLDGEVIPKDPWGHDYVYQCPGRHNTDSFDLFSLGSDGRAETEDDIGNWTKR